MNVYRDSGPLSQPLPPLRLPLHNGHTSPAEPSLSRISVPKMGVRARIADWPPRRERSRESLLENGNSENGRENGEAGIIRGGVAHMRRSKDAEFLEGGGWSFRDIPGSPLRFRALGFAPLRQRSNSEITLSEQDEAEMESRLLFREYGSTSSIDVQAVPEESFFDMLTQFQQERKPDQRSAAPARLGELLQGETSPDMARASPDVTYPSPRPEDRPESRVRKKSGSTESSLGTSSLFRKLRGSNRADPEASRSDAEDMGRTLDMSTLKPWLCVRSFAHYDAQSILFDLHEAAAQRSSAAQRRNTATGASAASSASAVSLAVSRALALGGAEPSFSSTDDLSCRDLMEALSSGPPHQLLLSCPNFLNETGSYGERNLSFLSSWAERGEVGGAEARLRPRCTNASISILEVGPEEQALRLERLQQHCIEHVDLGARYYRELFHGKGSRFVPCSLFYHGKHADYSLIILTSEQGCILEDAVPSTARHGTVRGLPLKEVLEFVLPELSVSCLRLALSTPKITEQLLKLDEQGLSQKHKVGILLCRADQSTEEEMYNNEEATPAFTEFLELLGETVCLRGFSKYAAQLDTKTDSTGTHSLYTTYQGYEIMFHVSTMLPYMPNNPQQLLRKRHIGNDIVTIIFQEPGALPFTPQNIRSHFQHVFLIIRVHSPCSDNTCYSVAVTRMKDVPPFGPPLPPSGVTFRDPAAFRSFLLAKIINAENAAHKSEKFHAMATRTRQGYLRDLAENCVSSAPLDTASKIDILMSLASKRRERARAREGAELGALGGIAWRVVAQDFGGGAAELPCVLAISAEFVVLADCSTKEVVFNCFCADVIGWTAERLALKIYYGRGDHVALRVPEGGAQDIREVVQRLKALTIGCETVDMTLRRNGLGQLGFHVRLDGTVSEVEEYGFAWQAGLRQGSRLVEICKVAAVTLTHEQMIDLLRTSVTVKVVIIPPYEEGGARSVSVGAAQRRQTRQDLQGKDSPNRHSKGEAQYSSHSSSNTLSSNASSSHSGERWFDGVGAGVSGALSDPSDPDPEPMGKGGSSDSGIDASTLYTPSPNTKPGKLSHSLAGTPHKSLHASATYSGLQELSAPARTAGEGRRRESSPIIPASANQSKSYRTRTFPPPGSASTDSFKPRACYTPQGYKSPAVAEKPRPFRASTATPTSGSAQLSTSAPKSFYGKSKANAWHQDEPPSITSTSSGVDMNSKNVFGQPRLRASLRDLRSPRRPPHKSTIEDDLKKLIIMDNPTTETPQQESSPRRTLQRTFSDESLCSGRRDASYASTPLYDGQAPPGDLLFTCTLPTRRHGHSTNHGALLTSKKVPLSASELSLTEVRDKVPPLRRLDPGLMPLPDTAAGLEWSSLVNAAKAYEVQRAVSLFSLAEPHAGGAELRPVISPVHFHTPQTPRTTPTFSSYLQCVYCELHINKTCFSLCASQEKQDKVALLAEMAHLRQNNQRLQEESHSASEQLRKFSQLLSNNASDRK
uniref:Signal-induced proliferation-associated 1 like 3 n=1 Tax=Astyanax mexicanus TaxID=7994 RepID=A0A8B9HHT1_ASTMX